MRFIRLIEIKECSYIYRLGMLIGVFWYFAGKKSETKSVELVEPVRQQLQLTVPFPQRSPNLLKIPKLTFT